MKRTSYDQLLITWPNMLMVAVVLFGSTMAVPGGSGYHQSPGYAYPNVGSHPISPGYGYPLTTDYGYPSSHFPSGVSGIRRILPGSARGHGMGMDPYLKRFSKSPYDSFQAPGGVKYKPPMQASGSFMPSTPTLTTPATLIGTHPGVTASSITPITDPRIGSQHGLPAGTSFLPGTSQKPKAQYPSPILPYMPTSIMPSVPFHSGAIPGIDHRFIGNKDGKWKDTRNYNLTASHIPISTRGVGTLPGIIGMPFDHGSTLSSAKPYSGIRESDWDRTRFPWQRHDGVLRQPFATGPASFPSHQHGASTYRQFLPQSRPVDSISSKHAFGQPQQYPLASSMWGGYLRPHQSTPLSYDGGYSSGYVAPYSYYPSFPIQSKNKPSHY